MADNEELDASPPQDISNVFVALDFLSCSLSYSAKYKHAWLKGKVIRSYILSARECTYACSRALSISLNHKEIAFIMAATGAILPKKMLMLLPNMIKRKNTVPCNISC